MHRDSRSSAVPEDINYDSDGRINSSAAPNSPEADDGETTTAANESENNKDTATIKGSYSIFMIAWEDANGEKKQMKEIKGTELTLNMDTSANTAMFKLSTYITLKTSRRNSNKQRVYLLIPPERINTITTKISPHRRSTAADVPDDYALHFSLTQMPDFIGPRIHHIESKRGTQEQLALIQRLATITEFTIHLTSSDAIARRRKDFELITTIFSLENPKNRPYKDKKHGDLATLYAGKGGKVINMDEGLAHAEASLPPYPGRFLRSPIRSPPSRSKKRRLASNELQRPNLNNAILKLHASTSDNHTRFDNSDDQYVDEKRRRPSDERRRPHSDVNDDPHRLSLLHSIQTSLGGLHTRLDDIENQSRTRHEDLHTRLDDIENQYKTRFITIEKSLGQIMDTLENLDAIHTPCRYNSVEKDSIGSIIQRVDESHDDFLTEFNWKFSDAIEDLKKQRIKGVTAISEEYTETAAKLDDKVISLRKALQNASDALSEFS